MKLPPSDEPLFDPDNYGKPVLGPPKPHKALSPEQFSANHKAAVESYNPNYGSV